MNRRFIKRVLDLTVSLFVLLLFLPILFPLTLVLAFVNKGAPFFLQRRPGKNERIFTIIKFKTMTDARNSGGELLPDFERITKVGGFVRKYSLDEIPQLLSVLRGDMSLIGPRP